jgi:hypothetical protein
MPAADHHCIDVHHHIVPPFYLDVSGGAKVFHGSGGMTLLRAA